LDRNIDMKTIKLILLTLIPQSFTSTVVAAYDPSVCENAGGAGQEYIRNYNNCIDKFDTAMYGSGPGVLGYLFMFIFAIVIITILYTFIMGLYDTWKNSRKLGEEGTGSVAATDLIGRAANLDAHLTKPQLVAFAKKEGVIVKSRDTKAQIIEKILKNH
jgi:putative exporter of polyketide antibiotics